jgi:CubicO group peptidase (beta-lactamase class C family)
MVNLQSVTKGLTAIALALLLEDGTLWLDEPAHVHIPELNWRNKADITIRHLATHTSGFPAGHPDWYASWKDRQLEEHPYAPYVRHALMHRLAFDPGTAQLYSDLGACVLGEIIYRASGQRVPDLLRKRVFQPLGLRRIGWDFDGELVQDCAQCVAEGWTHQRVDTREARQDGSVWGGLISNARDLAVMGLLLLREGELDGVRVLGPLTVRTMTSCQMGLPARGHFSHIGLFWWPKGEPPNHPELGHIVPDGTYYHAGAGHSAIVVMPALDIVAVVLRNRLGSPSGFINARDYAPFMDMVAVSVVAP